MKEERQKSVFPFIQPHLKISGLPVKDLNQICCWENYQYSLLCLDDNMFEEIYDLLIKKTEKQLSNHNNKIKLEMKNNIKKTDDKILYELEQAAANGSPEEIEALLEIFDKL